MHGPKPYCVQLLLYKTKMYKVMIFKEIQLLDIKYRFKMFDYLVCAVDGRLYQLTHFKKRRTCYFKEIPYNKIRKGYRINSVWIPFSRLDKLKYDCLDTIEI